MVSVPSANAQGGSGFRFELPKQARDLIGRGNAVATLQNGEPLPDWLRFDPQKLDFDATQVPDNALPLRVIVGNGAKRILVVISRRQ